MDFEEWLQENAKHIVILWEQLLKEMKLNDCGKIANNDTNLFEFAVFLYQNR